MKNEIDNKRQDVGNANSLHPYAGALTSHTAYYLCAKFSIANFPYYFKENLKCTCVCGVVFLRCRKEKSCTAFLLFISADWQRVSKYTPSAKLFEILHLWYAKAKI